ncbi:MAG: glutamate dehydrogenase, partial [Acidobacteria bacterium]|nr:glutamate dehydrogenase [Acidobacteriota bacterium]
LEQGGYVQPGLVGDAAGRGVMIAAREAARHVGLDITRATVAVQGFGNVGSVSALLLARGGAKVVGITDAAGGVANEAGLDVPALLEWTGRHGTMRGFPGGEPLTNPQLFGLDVDVLIPAALENQITVENVGDIRARIVVEGANGPTTPLAHRRLHERGIFVVPDILANAGGVITSYFEWVQDRHGYFWEEAEVNVRLEQKLCAAFGAVLATAERHGVDMRTAAYMVAIDRVGTVTRMRGMYA